MGFSVVSGGLGPVTIAQLLLDGKKRRSHIFLVSDVSTLTAIVNGHKQSQIDDLLPWNYPDKV
ncbi:MAG: hypothetical protein L0I29_10950 [Hyphomicrobiales bacterium]|nr:hypothetical protein [Hyphomicrobiales bacterium]